jgi:TPR repeat protein
MALADAQKNTSFSSNFDLRKYYLNRYYSLRKIESPLDSDILEQMLDEVTKTPSFYSDTEKLAKSQNNAESYFVCALILEEGTLAKRNLDLAREYYQKAAGLGNRDAQFELGRIYEKGNCGVSEDVTMAEFFYNEALSEGHPQAQVQLDVIAKKKRQIPTPSSQVNSYFFGGPQAAANNSRTSSAVTATTQSIKHTTSGNTLIEILREVKKSKAGTPEEKREESKSFNMVLNSLWNQKGADFYLTVDDINELYDAAVSIDLNPLNFYNIFIKDKLISLIESNNLIELEEALKKLTRTTSDSNQQQQLSLAILAHCYEPWAVAFRLATSMNNNEAQTLLIRYAASSPIPAIQEKLKQLISSQINAIQAENERLMAQASVIKLLRQATNPELSVEADGYLYNAYKQLYGHSYFHCMLELVSLATKGQHDLANAPSLTLEQRGFKLYFNERSESIGHIKLNSDPELLGVYSYGENHHKNAIYIGLGKYATNPIEIRGTLIHELTHFIANELYKNKCNPFTEGDKEGQKRWIHVVDGETYGICGRLSEKAKAKVLPSPFSDLFADSYYSKESWPREVIAVTAEYLSYFDNESDAKRALCLIDEDLYSFYFNCFLPDVAAHVEAIKERNNPNPPLVTSRRHTTPMRVRTNTTPVTYVKETGESSTSSSYPPASYNPFPPYNPEVYSVPPSSGLCPTRESKVVSLASPQQGFYLQVPNDIYGSLPSVPAYNARTSSAVSPSGLYPSLDQGGPSSQQPYYGSTQYGSYQPTQFGASQTTYQQQQSVMNYGQIPDVRPGERPGYY